MSGHRRLAVCPFTGRTVVAGSVLQAFIHNHAVDTLTREVVIDEVDLVTVPIEYAGRCDHTVTICPTCKDSWSLDYVFDTL